jgi:hypothetical protein
MRHGIVIEEIGKQDFISLTSPFIRYQFGIDQIDTKDITEENDCILFSRTGFLGVGDVCSERVEDLKVTSRGSFVDVYRVSLYSP